MLQTILDYLDQLPIEEVDNPDSGRRISSNFKFFLKLFDLLILYSVSYALAKTIQFVLALLLNVSMECVLLVYFAFPLLYLVESGHSKLSIASNFWRFVLRAFAKFCVLLLIDRGVLALLHPF